MLLLLAFILATEVLDIEMAPQDKKKTGLYKLTEKERSALQLWVDNNYEKRPAPIQNKPPAQKPTVSEVLQNGKYVRLSDNSLWQIRPQDTAITQSWITVVEIVIDKSGDPQYPSKLTNTLTGSSVRAKQVTSTTMSQGATPPVQPTKPTPGGPNQPAQNQPVQPRAVQPPEPTEPPPFQPNAPAPAAPKNK